MEIWWLSNSKMTIKVKVNKGRIVAAAPIVRRFIGQPFHNLNTWMYRMDDKMRIWRLK